MLCKKVYILESLWKLYKTINQSISSYAPEFFYWKRTQREIGYTKGTPRALGHWGSEGILALGHSRHSGTGRAFRQWGVQGTWAALRHFGQ